jgi:methylthioribose-1-phosphate isomerase
MGLVLALAKFRSAASLTGNMLVDGIPYRTVWLGEDGDSIHIIDQRQLPFSFVKTSLRTVEEVVAAIKEMLVRGAGCIGATAGYGMFLAAIHCSRKKLTRNEFDREFTLQGEKLKWSRPTAINLAWAVDRQVGAVSAVDDVTEKLAVARAQAEAIANEDAEWCRRIGEHGLTLLRELFDNSGKKTPLNILTHCNAGWLAFVDYGSATAPIYAAHAAGIPVHVWVDETRPRNQGARLTAWELAQQGVPHTVIADNVGGHLMQHGLVDLVITGSDRTTVTGDVANKIGTYLKALAARDNDVPFYVALPSSTFDWQTRDGVSGIPIEQRDGTEVRRVSGMRQGAPPFAPETEVNLLAEETAVANYAFDVTPARLVSGLITERGVCAAREDGIRALFPDAP